MRHVASLFFGACLASGVLAFAACTTDYQQGLGDPAYGAPNALENQKPPRPTLENATAEGGGGSSSGGNVPKCAKAGGTVVDGGPCAVSFKNDVLRIYGAATPACGSSECHGGKTPIAQPPIDPGLPDDTYAALEGFQAAGKPYVNPCSTDPAASSMVCNLRAGAQACGSHMPKGGQLAEADITTIETWVKCGAPNN